jgi:hypothetical protein
MARIDLDPELVGTAPCEFPHAGRQNAFHECADPLAARSEFRIWIAQNSKDLQGEGINNEIPHDAVKIQAHEFGTLEHETDAVSVVFGHPSDSIVEGAPRQWVIDLSVMVRGCLIRDFRRTSASWLVTPDYPRRDALQGIRDCGELALALARYTRGVGGNVRRQWTVGG